MYSFIINKKQVYAIILNFQSAYEFIFNKQQIYTFILYKQQIYTFIFNNQPVYALRPTTNMCVYGQPIRDPPYFSAANPNLFYQQLFHPNFC